MFLFKKKPVQKAEESQLDDNQTYGDNEEEVLKNIREKLRSPTGKVLQYQTPSQTANNKENDDTDIEEDEIVEEQNEDDEIVDEGDEIVEEDAIEEEDEIVEEEDEIVEEDAIEEEDEIVEEEDEIVEEEDEIVEEDEIEEEDEIVEEDDETEEEDEVVEEDEIEEEDEIVEEDAIEEEDEIVEEDDETEEEDEVIEDEIVNIDDNSDEIDDIITNNAKIGMEKKKYDDSNDDEIEQKHSMDRPESQHKNDYALINDSVKQQTQNYIGELLATANATQKQHIHREVQDITLVSLVAPVIREHVKVWLNDNLASLVNDIVKTEIKRLLPDEYR